MKLHINTDNSQTVPVTYNFKITSPCLSVNDTEYIALAEENDATNSDTTGRVNINGKIYKILYEKKYALMIKAPVNQSYTVYEKQSTNYTKLISGNTTQTVYIAYGNSYKIVYTANSATAQYTYTASSDVTGTMTQNTTIESKSATFTLNSYTFTITQNSNETITVKTNRGTYTSNFTAYYGDTWTASVSASSGYEAGALSATSGTVTSDTSITVGDATRNYSVYGTFKFTSTSSYAVTNCTPSGIYSTAVDIISPIDMSTGAKVGLDEIHLTLTSDALSNAPSTITVTSAGSSYKARLTNNYYVIILYGNGTTVGIGIITGKEFIVS